MAVAQDLAVSGGGVGVGVGTTVGIRRQFDNSGESTVLRPSVLWGVGTGALALGAPLVTGKTDGIIWKFLKEYGVSALTAGVFSAFNPKGAGVQLPTV